MYVINTPSDAKEIAELQHAVLNQREECLTQGQLDYVVFQIPTNLFAHELSAALEAFLSAESADVIMSRTRAPRIAGERSRLTLPFLLPLALLHKESDMFVPTNICGMDSSQIVMQPHYKDKLIKYVRNATYRRPDGSVTNFNVNPKDLVQGMCWTYLRSCMRDVPYEVNSNQAKLFTRYNRRRWAKLLKAVGYAA